LVLHPVLLAIFPVLHLFVNNILEASDWEVLLCTAIVIVAAILMVLLMWAILKDVRKSELIASVSVILFFSYGYVVQASSEFFGGDALTHVYFRYIIVMLVWGMILALSAYLIIRTRRKLDIATKFLNITIVILHWLFPGNYSKYF